MNNKQNKAALPKDLKRKNQREILKVFQNSSKEEWSLAELSQVTGISRATVAKAVAAFSEKHVVVYRGKGNSTDVGGKRPDVYAFNREYQFLVYLNIGIGYLTMAVLDLKLEELARVEAAIPMDSNVGLMVEKAMENYGLLVERTGIKEEKIYGLCISTSGMVNQETGVLQCTLSYPYWGKEIPLLHIFEERFPRLRVLVENVARAAGRAELYHNREYEEKKIFTLFTYRGISGCLIDHGKVLSSANSLIGEVGHMIICPQDERVCRCKSRGCFENMVSQERILDFMRSDPEKLEKSVLGGMENVRLRDILLAANQGDSYARGLTDQAAWYFSLALRNIILTVDPEVIVIQGRYCAGGEYFKNRVEDYLYNPAYFPRPSDWSLIYDERDIWKLAETGLSAAMAEDLFRFAL